MSELPTDAVTFSDGPDDTIEWKIEMPLRFVVIDGKLVELRPADPEPPKVMGVRRHLAATRHWEEPHD